MSTALKKQTGILEESSSRLLQAALDSRAEQAEVCATYSQRTKINLEKQDFHLTAKDEGFVFGVRVICGRRQGFASGNSTDPKDLREVAARAVEIALLSPENPLWTIVPSGNIPKDAPQSLWDESLTSLSLTTQKEWAEHLVKEACQDPRFRLNEGSVSVSSGLFLILNSLGTHKLEKESLVSWGLMGMAVEDQNITSFDYFGEICRKASSVSDRLVASTRKFQDRVLKCLDQAPAKAYRGPVFFTPRAVADIFLSSLSYHLNGRNVLDGTSRWHTTALETRVLSETLTLRDLPWLRERSGFALFDREGTPTRNLSLIESGVLKSFLMDNYAASGLKKISTGHAVAGPTALPAVSPHCLALNSGTQTLQALHESIPVSEYLVVHRYSGQTDPVTGDFSGVAKGGEWWSAGKRLHSVKETLIAGNLFEALGAGLLGVSKETEIIDSAEETPALVCDGISVTSG